MLNQDLGKFCLPAQQRASPCSTFLLPFQLCDLPRRQLPARIVLWLNLVLSLNQVAIQGSALVLKLGLHRLNRLHVTIVAVQPPYCFPGYYWVGCHSVSSRIHCRRDLRAGLGFCPVSDELLFHLYRPLPLEVAALMCSESTSPLKQCLQTSIPAVSHGYCVVSEPPTLNS